MLEAALYSAVGPTLPHYVSEFHLSKAASGMLVGGYAAGLLIGSLLVLLSATRIGVKRATIGGLAVLSASTVGFGFAHIVELLDLFRILQGLGAGTMWAGALAWSLSAVSSSRQGEFIGALIAIGTVGTLLGPLIGVVAIALGPRLVFPLVGVAVAGLLPFALRVPDAPPQPGLRLRDSVVAFLGIETTGYSCWIVVLVGTGVGMQLVLLPLRLHHLGVDSFAIGAVFLVAAVIQALAAILLGRIADRRSALPLIQAGLGLCFVLMVGLAVVESTVLTVGLCVFALASWPLLSLPAIANLSQRSAEHELPRLVVFSFVTLAWALGELVGGPLGSAAAQVSEAATFAVLGAAALLSALVPGRIRSGA